LYSFCNSLYLSTIEKEMQCHAISNKLSVWTVCNCVTNVTIINCSRLSELNFALQEVKLESSSAFTQLDNDNETEHYLLAKSYFDLKEYDRWDKLYKLL
jgi:hypothetical protein